MSWSLIKLKDKIYFSAGVLVLPNNSQIAVDQNSESGKKIFIYEQLIYELRDIAVQWAQSDLFN